MVLGRRDGVGDLSIFAQRGDRQRLVAVSLVDAEEPDRCVREQLVERGLHVGAHVPGKLPRGRNQFVLRDAGEMPFQRLAGVFERLLAHDVTDTAGDRQ